MIGEMFGVSLRVVNKAALRVKVYKEENKRTLERE
jgi:hypothetical protein